MLAGNVMVNVVDGGNVYIRGDSADNHIEIIGGERASGEFEIIGFGGTTLNGQSNPIVVTGLGNGASFGDIASIESELGLRGNLGQGNDTMLVDGVKFKGKSILYGGPGDDSIGLHQAEFPNDLTVQTFTGDDSIAFNNSIMRGETRIFSLDGNYTIGFDSVSFYGDTLVVTGNNNDEVGTDRSTFVGDTLILTQAGNDFVTVGNDLEFDIPGGLKTKAKRVFLGDGNDAFVATEALFRRNPTVFSGQDGFDRVEVSFIDLPDNNVDVRSFEQNHVVDSTVRVDQLYNDLIVRRALLADVTDTVAAIPELSTFSSALEMLELKDDFRNGLDSKPTVFAPTDAAFEALLTGTLDALSDSELLDLINFHRGVAGEEGGFFSRDLAELGELDTFFGQSIPIEVTADGLVLNGNAKLLVKDFRTDRGVIHVIDTVLFSAN